MTSDTGEAIPAAKIEVSDAIIRVWERLSSPTQAMVMNACRENAELSGEDPFATSGMVTIAIDQLQRTPDDEALNGRRLELVDAVLRV